MFDRRSIPEDAVESKWLAPDDHPIRRIKWAEPSQSKGSLLFLPGRGEAYEKYLETFEHWRGQGWQVTSLDWRGQAGSGRFGLDDVTGHISDFAVWTADLAAFWREWVLEQPGPHVIVAHSMGGHLALRAVAERALDPVPAAMILTAPMLDVPPSAVPRPIKRVIGWVMSRLVDSRSQAWKWGENPGEVPEGRKALLTHDDDRYEDELWWRKERPELAMGPGSWGWISAALSSAARLGRPGVLEAVDVPALVLATTADRLVPFHAVRRVARRLPHARVLWFGAEAGHEILREADTVRDRALASIDEFLDGVAGR